jgi:plasmid stabilization system protein ParE
VYARATSTDERSDHPRGGQVVSAARQGENDYLASCKDGNRYHVYTNAQGRVVVQKQ